MQKPFCCPIVQMSTKEREKLKRKRKTVTLLAVRKSRIYSNLDSGAEVLH